MFLQATPTLTIAILKTRHHNPSVQPRGIFQNDDLITNLLLHRKYCICTYAHMHTSAL